MLINKKYIVWLALTVPLLLFIAWVVLLGAPGGRLFYWTGVISMILIFITLATTPLLKISNRSTWSRWLLRHRRYFGVAAFGYMAAHTAFFVFSRGSLNAILASFNDFDIVLGWVCGVVFTAMALTSNDYSVRKLGPGWKSLQRWVYFATPVALLHWLIAVAFDPATVLIYGSMFAVVIMLRIVAAKIVATSVSGKGFTKL